MKLTVYDRTGKGLIQDAKVAIVFRKNAILEALRQLSPKSFKDLPDGTVVLADVPSSSDAASIVDQVNVESETAGYIAYAIAAVFAVLLWFAFFRK